MTLFLLALHPHHQEMCRAEVDAVFSDPNNYSKGKVQYHALPGLKHLERCILEANRMLSISSILMRKLEEPLTLRESFDTFVYHAKIFNIPFISFT